MSRTVLAAPVGLIGFCLYLALAMVLGDAVVGAHWTLQVIYYLLAGILWALPARWLILWAGGKR